MNVGILTFHNAKNYGAVIQAFALKTALKKLGVNPYIINRYAGYKTIIHQIYFTLHPKFFLSRLKWILFDQFSMRYLSPKTNKYLTFSSLNDFERRENLEALIVGSDQVWRMEFSAIGYNYFFDFIKKNNSRKISYAASFGKDKWREHESVTNHVKKLLKDFSAISVREKSGVRICTDIFNVHATHVLDPTLLLTREDYESILLKDYSKKINNTLVSYLLGNIHEEIKYCNQFAQNNDLDYSDLYYIYPLRKVFSASRYGIKHYLHLSVPEWLGQIKNATYLVTNSFHATIFAILFNKQFIVVDHPEGGTDRVTSLLDVLGLKNRFVYHISEISIELLQNEIDFDSVQSKLDLEKEQSILFLQNALFKT